MSSFDRESFHLLQMSDSASDSVPDLDLVIPNTSVKKKKVRLKRKERKGRQIGPLKSFDDVWTCPLSPNTSSANPSCLLAIVSSCFVLVLIVMGYFTSTLHSRMVRMEHQLRMKIVDDDSRSIPETLQLIQSKLQSLQSNQSEVLTNLSDLGKSVTNLQARLDMVNITVNKERGEGQIKQSVADLGVKVSEIKQSLAVTTNNSNSNTVSIQMIATELSSLKLNDIDLRNGAGTAGTPHISVNPSDLSNLKKDFVKMNASLVQQAQTLGNMNSSLLNMAQNCTVMIDWVKQDVVSVQAKVSQLQDDNQNMSSHLASLAEQSKSQFLTTLANMSSLQSTVSAVDRKLQSVKTANSLLMDTVLPTPSTPAAAAPPGLSSAPAAPLSSTKTSQVQPEALPVVSSGPDQHQAGREGPRDRRQAQASEVFLVTRKAHSP
eukprot:GFUD01099522.1.p1 GENE.GFUD01099522.1~~GFUD01099522.1.p1  ORF type:complete len:433 (-),score=148.48 GFUD01099522.1:308-1606(-)